MVIAHQNRIKVQQPRGRAGWCMGCDMAKVSDGQKCHVCGHREMNRDKKPSPLADAWLE